MAMLKGGNGRDIPFLSLLGASAVAISREVILGSNYPGVSS